MVFLIEFFKAFFSKSDLSDNPDDLFRCFTTLIVLNIYFSLFNKIWDDDFPSREWNLASIISIPKKKKKKVIFQIAIIIVVFLLLKLA